MVLTVAEAGRKGGKARLRTMSADERKEVAASGGKKRASNLTQAERSKAAQKAAAARWAEHRRYMKAMDKSLDAIEKTGKKLDALTKARKKKSSEKRLGAKLRD